ncbi:sugar ABC transporter permease, partial [Turicibacter sanguinis]|nr:sugar ABC transporter permease [Turicibacter sanguinis]
MENVKKVANSTIKNEAKVKKKFKFNSSYLYVLP